MVTLSRVSRVLMATVAAAACLPTAVALRVAETAMPDADVRVAIVYATATSDNFTRTLANAIAAGAAGAGATTRVLAVAAADFERDVLAWPADALVLGSPTVNGNPSASLLAWVESTWERFWHDPRCDGKLGAVFATGGDLALGVEHVLAGLQRLLWTFRFDVVTPDATRADWRGMGGYASYGAVAITQTPPFFNATPPGIAAPFVAAGEALGAAVVRRARARRGLRP